MHRVELKGKRSKKIRTTLLYTVPNVPCGVERGAGANLTNQPTNVPNVPCGVERQLAQTKIPSQSNQFLMYRVELKGGSELKQHAVKAQLFLMYRVELKAD